MKFGVYVHGVLIDPFDDIMEAYEKAMDRTRITCVPHEVKVISKNKVMNVLQQIRENKAIKEPYPQFFRLDECLVEIYDSIKGENDKESYCIQVFTNRDVNRDGECFAGISYGVRIAKGEEVKWEKDFIRGNDSAFNSDIANFQRATLLQVCNSIALYFQQDIFKRRNIGCEIVLDFNVFNEDAFVYDPSDTFVRQCILNPNLIPYRKEG